MAVGTAKKIQKELCILCFAAPIILKGTSWQPSTHSGIIWANLAIMIRSPMYDRLNVASLKMHSKDTVKEICVKYENLKGIDKVAEIN